jgi:hypothetical protein
MTQRQATQLRRVWRDGGDCEQFALAEWGMSAVQTKRELARCLTDKDRAARWQLIGVSTMRQFTDEDLATALRSTPHKGKNGPTRAEYQAMASASPKPVPAIGTLDLRYGSWSAALKAAGFQRKQATRPTPKWTDAQLAAELARVATEHDGRLPSIGEYERLRHSLNDRKLPSAILIRKRYGSWSRARLAAARG